MNSYLKKIDDSFQSYYLDFDRVLKNQDSFVFLTPNRLDIIFKICYIHFLLKNNETKFNRLLLYILFKNQKKILPLAFQITFAEYEEELFNSLKQIKKTNLDNFFIIPIDKNNEVIDTGNKLALSVALNKKVDIVKFNSISKNFSLIELNSFFNLEKNSIITNYLMFNYINYHEYLRIILLFPCRKKQYEKETLNSIRVKGNIVIRKRLKINTLVNAYYIIKNLYFGANWIGNLKNDYKGALWKAKCCFEGTNGELDVILFYPKNKENSQPNELKKMKEEIRKYHNVHYHSIHSSDNQIETQRYAKLFFHDESSKILANKRNNFFLGFEKVLEILSKENINQDNFIFSGSMSLAAMGIRSPNDIDVIHDKSFNFNLEIFKKTPFDVFGGLHSHNDHIKSYLPNYKINELIYNPNYFFYYMGFKFIHPKIVYELKVKRYNNTKKEKDIRDIKDIKDFFKIS